MLFLWQHQKSEQLFRFFRFSLVFPFFSCCSHLTTCNHWMWLLKKSKSQRKKVKEKKCKYVIITSTWLFSFKKIAFIFFLLLNLSNNYNKLNKKQYYRKRKLFEFKENQEISGKKLKMKKTEKSKFF